MDYLRILEGASRLWAKAARCLENARPTFAMPAGIPHPFFVAIVKIVVSAVATAICITITTRLMLPRKAPLNARKHSAGSL
ncbi:hypothetical protein ACMAY6_00270 [Luminiphilus sp. nBUS_16]|uniref:hypothetical protein n=1 Tax=Luminiphilus sp. nBUS_16 TaxID=3395315 RepID=UPI003EBAF90E